MTTVFEKPRSLTDAVLHYCPGCTHGIVHRLVAERQIVCQWRQERCDHHLGGREGNGGVPPFRTPPVGDQFELGAIASQ